ncbi:MAG: Trk system potassium transporter TrkA [Ruminococcaceae bacterium]|nr:Trk system potassium transporter TrkA [Oscillospiraceae bacterium]
MNIIIVGCGKVGQKLAEQLSQEKIHNITVLDTRYNVIQDLINQFDIMGVVGSCTDIDVLAEAGVKDANILIAVTGSDELNLLTCLMAKKTGNCQTIARVRRPEYSKELHIFKEDLGLAMIINPEQTAAAEMARILRAPSAIQIDTFAKGRAEIIKFKIGEKSPLEDVRIADIIKKIDSDILVCGVERGEDAFIPGGDFILRRGDLVSIVATLKSGVDFFKKIGFNTNRVRDTIIVGGGDTAYYLAKILLATGVKVKLVEKNEQRCEELCSKLPKATIINGDGTDNNLLLEEGLEYAQSFVSMTNIDEENILLSLYAKSKMEGKVITKVNRVSYDDVIDGLDLGSVIYPKNITADHIVKFVRAMNNSIGNNIETMHVILGGNAEALEFRIRENSKVTGIPLSEIKLKSNTLIACINRSGNIILPRGRDTIEVDDTVIVVTTNHGFNDIKDILE